ncbi:MAG: DUF2520 domain-containing protein [Candidatus Desulforudis sp.]|nr:DUF2520 domain-containing protein [Desulforudis sp.]
MQPRDRTVCIVGAGKVGSTLALALHTRGYRIVGVASRSAESARSLGAGFGCPSGTRPEELTRAADVVLITTPDREIAAVARDVQARGGFAAGQLVAHTSGATPAAALAPARESGAPVVSIHPLQSFADVEPAGARLAGCYFGLEGDPPAIARARRLVADLGGIPLVIKPEDKALYHAAACVASNYLVAVIHLAVEMLGRCGLSRDDALEALAPLIDGTWNNIRAVGVVPALTGPVCRGDRSTLACHLAALSGQPQVFDRVYRVLGAYAAGMAEERGALGAAQAREIVSLFEEGKPVV